jgi:ABC-2 type transport system permease protein
MTDAYHARVEELPWVDPAPRNGLLEVFRRRYLLTLLVRREISARYSGSFLGLIWSYINPLSQFLIYFMVIGVLLQLHKDVPNFAIHMFCGIILVHYFTETFNAGTRSIVRNKAIVRKMAMPNEMFPVASMLVSLYHVVPQVVILVIACLFYGWVPDPGGALAVVLALLIIMILGVALALLFSAANVFFRDWSSFVNILSNLVRFGVPMIYPYSIVDERFGSLAPYYLLNPIANAVLLFQRAFWVGTTDDPDQTAIDHLPDHLYARGFAMIGVCLVFLLIAQMVFSRLESKIPERI